MTSHEFLCEEVQRLAAKAAEFERLYLRAKESCRSHQTGLRRVHARLVKAQTEIDLMRASHNAERGRLWAENASLRNKVERLSLKLIAHWNQELHNEDRPS